ncbi:unnamed protein product [Trichogramma brassicae]|uniref:G-protein coupled receptors family 2 profile 2 domain-containing protein n=1 Tax=Trichogramma brassicae TaxID=86971 RepID=A0A6H5IME3_9HYME|nr:unnamed protein product [Trichogramma brassicae]
MYYFVISGFLWMNVTCFDIWWTFGERKEASAKAVIFLLRRARKEEPEKQRGRTDGLDEESPTQDSAAALLPVRLGPAAAVHRHPGRVRLRQPRANQQSQFRRQIPLLVHQLLMNFKLFVIMGVLFCMEMVSDFLENIPELAYDTWFRYALLLTDTLNGLQGLWVFCLFVLKTKVLRALATRLGCGRAVASRRRGPNGARGRVNTAYFSRTTSTSLANTSSSNGQNGGSGLMRSTIDGVLRRFSSASSLNSAMSVTGSSLKP